MNKPAFLLLLLGMLLTPLGLAQGVYKWTDSAGKVHYGDAPTESKAKSVNTKDPMQGSVAPTSEQKLRAENAISQAQGGHGGMEPERKKCPYAK